MPGQADAEVGGAPGARAPWEHAEWARDRICEIYTEHRPSKLSSVAKLMEAWRGSEEELLAKIEAKYIPDSESVVARKLKQEAERLQGERDEALAALEEELSDKQLLEAGWNGALRTLEHERSEHSAALEAARQAEEESSGAALREARERLARVEGDAARERDMREAEQELSVRMEEEAEAMHDATAALEDEIGRLEAELKRARRAAVEAELERRRAAQAEEQATKRWDRANEQGRFHFTQGARAAARPAGAVRQLGGRWAQTWLPTPEVSAAVQGGANASWAAVGSPVANVPQKRLSAAWCQSWADGATGAKGPSDDHGFLGAGEQPAALARGEAGVGEETLPGAGPEPEPGRGGEGKPRKLRYQGSKSESALRHSRKSRQAQADAEPVSERPSSASIMLRWANQEQSEGLLPTATPSFA